VGKRRENRIRRRMNRLSPAVSNHKFAAAPPNILKPADV
jgi:hypothetical protein